jgi:hypothetical protein
MEPGDEEIVLGQAPLHLYAERHLGSQTCHSLPKLPGFQEIPGGPLEVLAFL